MAMRAASSRLPKEERERTQTKRKDDVRDDIEIRRERMKRKEVKRREKRKKCFVGSLCMTKLKRVET